MQSNTCQQGYYFGNKEDELSPFLRSVSHHNAAIRCQAGVNGSWSLCRRPGCAVSECRSSSRLQLDSGSGAFRPHVTCRRYQAGRRAGGGRWCGDVAGTGVKWRLALGRPSPTPPCWLGHPSPPSGPRHSQETVKAKPLWPGRSPVSLLACQVLGSPWASGSGMGGTPLRDACAPWPLCPPCPPAQGLAHPAGLCD